MERLTRTSDSGEVAFTFNLYINCLPSEANKILNVATKLKEYEDLEEQDRLLKLPCKVGDKIFLDFSGFGKDVDEFMVKDFHLDCFEDGGVILFCDYESNDRIFSGQIDVTEFGKTVFITKSEAEAKLKELRGSNEQKKSNT